MSVSTDMVATWIRPRSVFRRWLGRDSREGRALAVLMGACLLIFVAQWPRLSREAFLAQEAARNAGTPVEDLPGIQALMGINLFALIFVAPVIFYAIAALSHAVARALGGKGTGFASRLALFWALLATAPLMLFQGLVAGFIGAGPGLTATGVAVALAFVSLWGILLHEAHQGGEARDAA